MYVHIYLLLVTYTKLSVKHHQLGTGWYKIITLVGLHKLVEYFWISDYCKKKNPIKY